MSHDRPLVLSYPGFVYDMAQLALFPVNYAIGGLCRLRNRRSTWDEPAGAPRADAGIEPALDQLKESILAGRDVTYDEAELVRLYDSLPTVRADEEVVGRAWRGRIVRTGSSVLDLAEWVLVRPLTRLGFGWGKRYRTRHIGDPLMVRWKDLIYAPIPVWGNVGVVDISWRGELTATMNYDRQPWKDYFRRLSDDGDEIVLLGVWTHKHIAGGWFTLTLDRGCGSS